MGRFSLKSSCEILNYQDPIKVNLFKLVSIYTKIYTGEKPAVAARKKEFNVKNNSKTQPLLKLRLPFINLIGIHF